MQPQEQLLRLSKPEAEVVRRRRRNVPLEGGDLDALGPTVSSLRLDQDCPPRFRHQRAPHFEALAVTDREPHPQLGSTLSSGANFVFGNVLKKSAEYVETDASLITHRARAAPRLGHLAVHGSGKRDPVLVVAAGMTQSAGLAGDDVGNVG